jgi:formiminoglutamase
MNLNEYFLPVNKRKDLLKVGQTSDSWLDAIAVYEKDFPRLDGKKMAFIGIINDQYDKEANLVRSFLYSCTKAKYTNNLVDLGNYMFNQNDSKSFEKLGYLISELIEKQIIPVILNGPHEITLSQYLGFEFLKKIHNIAAIDSKIDLEYDQKGNIDDNNYWAKILLRDPNYMFNLTHLAHQTYLTDSKTIDLLEKHYFELFRLGNMRDDLADSEPVLRGADIVSFDISSIRQGDAPGTNHPSPNGLNAEEACQITRYAGLGENLKCIGFFEYHSKNDLNHQTARLVAQMIWYLVNGFLHRDNEVVIGDSSSFMKYITSDSNSAYQVIFYKSKKTNRWWIEVPGNEKSRFYKKKQIIPCSYKDYQSATVGEIPERWWKAIKKLG